jgi:hypothetical protein
LLLILTLISAQTKLDVNAYLKRILELEKVIEQLKKETRNAGDDIDLDLGSPIASAPDDTVFLEEDILKCMHKSPNVSIRSTHSRKITPNSNKSNKSINNSAKNNSVRKNLEEILRDDNVPVSNGHDDVPESNGYNDDDSLNGSEKPPPSPFLAKVEAKIHRREEQAKKKRERNWAREIVEIEDELPASPPTKKRKKQKKPVEPISDSKEESPSPKVIKKKSPKQKEKKKLLLQARGNLDEVVDQDEDAKVVRRNAPIATVSSNENTKVRRSFNHKLFGRSRPTKKIN